MIGMNQLGQKGRLGNQLFQYASLVGIAKNMKYDFCIPDHSNATWFDRQIDGNTVCVYHHLQHLFEMNYLDGRFGEIDGNHIEVHQAEFCQSCSMNVQTTLVFLGILNRIIILRMLKKN